MIPESTVSCSLTFSNCSSVSLRRLFPFQTCLNYPLVCLPLIPVQIFLQIKIPRFQIETVPRYRGSSGKSSARTRSREQVFASGVKLESREELRRNSCNAILFSFYRGYNGGWAERGGVKNLIKPVKVSARDAEITEACGECT